MTPVLVGVLAALALVLALNWIGVWRAARRRRKDARRANREARQDRRHP